jgi:hypothetical protein
LNPKIRISETKSNSLWPPSDKVAEISLEEFTKVMKASFSIYSEPVPGKPYSVRYTGTPYDPSNEDCRSIQIPSHAKGTMLCPLVIFSVLDKFEIPIEDYLEAMAGQGKIVRMPPVPSGAE